MKNTITRTVAHKKKTWQHARMSEGVAIKHVITTGIENNNATLYVFRTRQTKHYMLHYIVILFFLPTRHLKQYISMYERERLHFNSRLLHRDSFTKSADHVLMSRLRL